MLVRFARPFAVVGVVLLSSSGDRGPTFATGGSPQHHALWTALQQVVASGSSAAAGDSVDPRWRRAILRAWAELLQARLGRPLRAEYEESPRSLVLQMPTCEPEIVAQQVALMESVPAAVRLKLLVSGAEVRDAVARLLDAHGRVDVLARIDWIDVPAGWFSAVWARDFAVGDEDVQVVPLFYGNEGLGPADPDQPRNELVSLLASRGARVVRAPLYFGGGNLLVARSTEGRRRMFCGTSDYLETEATYRRAGYAMTEAIFTTVLRAVFDVDDVVLLGRRDAHGAPLAQSHALFHLDQAMLFAGDGLAVVEEVVLPSDFPSRAVVQGSWQQTLSELVQRHGLPSSFRRFPIDHALPRADAGAAPGSLEADLADAEAARMSWLRLLEVHDAKDDLDSYAASLAAAGFTVERLPLSFARVVRRQYHVNALLLPRPGERSLLIMPTFTATGDEAGDEQEADDRAEALFSRVGFQVVKVRDIAHRGAGSHHCVVRRG